MLKSKKRVVTLATLFGFSLLSWLAYWYGERWLRTLLLYLSTAGWARQLISRVPIMRRVAGRFVAGEDMNAAITAARELNARGMSVTMDYLGESITHAQDAIAARDEILALLDCIQESGINANVSVKLSQLGLKISEALALDNMRQLLQRAQQHHNKIRIDMEESALIDVTLHLYRRLRDEYGFQNVGVVIQAYLYRSEADVAQLVEEGAWVRLCKGAYAEPPEIAFPAKADTDANFIKLMQMLLSEKARQNGVHVAIATHDEAMIQATIAYAQANQIAAREFEFQMLYGIRRELQETLVGQGYQMRIYVPYGTAWYAYFVRRLAERPANLWFFVSNLVRR